MQKLLPSIYNSPYSRQDPLDFMNEYQLALLDINISENKESFGKGYNGSYATTSYPKFNAPENANIIQNVNSYVVLGTDAPEGPGTGKSANGSRCSSIDMVTGRLSSVSSAAKNNNIWVNSNFKSDAARIYVSEFTDLDKAADLPVASNQPFENRSGIVAIADNVALKGRLGVKITTSPHGDHNSKGGQISSGSGIELIANSDDTDVQPIVKGDNLISALNSIYDRMNELADAIADLSSEQTKLMTALAAHTHVGNLGAPTTPSIDLLPTIIPSTIKVVTVGSINTLKNKLNTLMDEINYSYSLGSEYVNSDFNRTN